MAEKQIQNFENHAVFPRTLFYAVLPIFIGVILSIIGLFYVKSVAGLCLIGSGAVLTGLATIFGLGVARGYATGLQDRIIRIEMRQRLKDILPQDMHDDIPRLTIKQLVGLRFASDEELPELTRWTLDESIVDVKAIKRKVKNWRADSDRI